MKKGSFLKKCLSWVMAFAILLGVASPASAAIAALNEETYGYVAIGDAMTQGVGLNDPETEAYYAKVAEYLGTEFTAVADGRYRIEEIRYLLDDDYAGDGYTASIGGLSADRNAGTVKEYVKNAEVISINVGVNNFSTYLISQLVYYLENQGAVKYEYDFDEFGDSDVQDAMENVKNVVMDRLLAAAPDAMDDALELIEYVVEVSTYTYLSYMVSFNAVIKEIYELNPDAELYVVGIYNAMAGDVLTVDTGSRTVEVPIGEAFGALVELANVYTQILAPRAFDYIYVDPGTPELLIDVMGNTSIAPENRIPDALKLELLNSVEDTAISMIQEMFAQYGIAKTEDQAYAIAEDIFEKDSVARRDYIKSLIQEFAVDEVIDRFQEELKEVQSTYGSITVTEGEIITLLNNLEAATSDSERKQEATDFVVDLMTKAMVGQTFAGIKIETQQDAYDAIDLLERNSKGDPDALREAAADMIMAKVGENGLKDFITRDDVLDLLEQMDTTTSDAQREVIIDEWMNDLAVEKITKKIKEINPDYKETDAKALLAAMSGASEAERETIAKNHLLTTGGFHAYMVDKFEETYTDNGLTLQTYGSFDAFVTAVEQAADTNAAKAIVRTEIRAAAVKRVVQDDQFQNVMASKMSEADVLSLFTNAENVSDVYTYMFNAICAKYGADPEHLEDLQRVLLNGVTNVFANAYHSYNNAATAAEEAFAEYRDGVDTAAEGFAQYVSLKDTAAQQILDAYNAEYQGAGETALKYYADYLSLRDAAVEKVLKGYDEYDRAINLGLDTVDQFNETFDAVFTQLRAIAEVEKISLNHLVAVAKKLDANYVQNMVENLVQGDPLAAEDKTVAYIALRYYLANAMMIMPSAGGHSTIANRIITAIETGKSVNSTAGELANKVINTGADIYHAAKDFLSRPTNGSGQVETLKNPEVYVAFGDNVTSGTALSNPALAYPQLIGNALAMDYIYEDQDTEDDIYNYALNGMRAEELLMLLDSTYSGDAYTEGRFGKDYIAGLRAEYIENVKNADLITINVGINNLTTFPIQQTLLAFNGEETYEMDWARYIGQSRYEKISKGKTAVMDLLLGIVDNAESRKPVLDDLNAYEKAERALETASTTIESLFYGLIGYVVNLDAAVEAAAELNPNATIVLIGFYNPLEGTYFNVDKTIEIKDHELDLSKYTVDVSALTDKVINLANRYLTNYVGYIADDVTAADEGSRIVSVPILNTQLGVTDTGASKDLSTLATWKTVSVKGHEIDIMVPEYFLEAGKNVGVNLHPNATGHAYIASKVLNALDFEIHATVYLQDAWKYFGESDPESYDYLIDDLSSLYGEDAIVLDISREEGEALGEYPITAEVVAKGGYESVTVVVGTFRIVEKVIEKTPVYLEVKLDENEIIYGEALPGYEIIVTDAVTGTVIEGVNVSIADMPSEGADADTYVISAVLEDTENYVLAGKTDATLIIKPRPVTITVEPAGNTYIEVGSAQVPNYTVVVKDGGNELTGLNVVVNGLPEDTNTAGIYNITATLNEGNYVVTSNTGATLTIYQHGTVKNDRRWTMSLDSVIYLNYYPVLDGFADYVDFGTAGGVVIWDGDVDVTNRNQVQIGAPNTHTIPGMYYNEELGWYVKTDEIFAKNIGDKCWLRVYVEVAPGVYDYGPAVWYSPENYCRDQLVNVTPGTDTLVSTKAVCAALLEYGAAAQRYFDYNTDKMVNSGLTNVRILNDDGSTTDISYADFYLQYLKYNSQYIDELDAATAAMSSTIAGNRGSISLYKTASLDLQGAIKLNVYYSIDTNVIDMSNASVKVYFWTEEQYKAATAENGALLDYSTYSAEMTEIEIEGKTYYTTKSDHILAKNLGGTVYFCCVAETENGVYRSGLGYYSPEAYIKDTMSYDSVHVDLVQRIAVYSEMARIRFLNNK